MQLYVIYDKLAEESGPIVECKNHAVAVRNYRQVVDKTGRPEEFQLLYLGKIDHGTNAVEVLSIPEEITTGIPAMAVQGGK